MNTRTIKILGKDYKYAFKQTARRLFMQRYNLEYFTEYQKKVEAMIPDAEKGMGLSGLRTLADLLITAIESETDETVDLKTLELADYLMDNPDEMQNVMTLMSESSEQPEKGKNKTLGGSGGKSKRVK